MLKGVRGARVPALWGHLEGSIENPGPGGPGGTEGRDQSRLGIQKKCRLPGECGQGCEDREETVGPAPGC